MHMVCVSEGKGGGKKPVRRLGGTLRSEIHLGLSCRAKIFLPTNNDKQARLFRTRPAWFLVARRKERCLVPRWEAGSRRVAERKKHKCGPGFLERIPALMVVVVTAGLFSLGSGSAHRSLRRMLSSRGMHCLPDVVSLPLTRLRVVIAFIVKAGGLAL